jgi:hypothetical protein
VRNKKGCVSGIMMRVPVKDCIEFILKSLVLNGCGLLHLLALHCFTAGGVMVHFIVRK